MCVKLRPDWLPVATCIQAIPICCDDPGFVIHPSTSELAEQLMVDPEALARENYSGLYDENGDYVPQYCDDPEKIPQGRIEANPTASAAASDDGASGQSENNPPAEPSNSDTGVE